MKVDCGIGDGDTVSSSLKVNDSSSNENSIQNVEELLEDYLKDDNEVPNIITANSHNKSQPTKVITTVTEVQEEKVFKEEAQKVVESVNDVGGCCGYKAKYESLLDQQNKTEAILRQVNSNLTSVTRELMSRDRTMQKYIEAVSHIFNLVSFLILIIVSIMKL